MRAARPATCRDCDRSPAEGARFAGLSRTRCTDCAGARRSSSAAIHALLRPAAPPVVGGNQPTNHAAHLAWIRRQPCPVRLPRCASFATHAHHVRIGGTGGGMGLKPGDEWCVPLCGLHHDELHRIGQITFDRKHGLDLRDLAQRLARKSPHLNATLSM